MRRLFFILPLLTPVLCWAEPCQLRWPGMLLSDGPAAVVWTVEVDPAVTLAVRQEEVGQVKAFLQSRPNPPRDPQIAAETFVLAEACRDMAQQESLHHADKGKLKVFWKHIWQGTIENGYWHFKNDHGQRHIQPEWPTQ